MDMQSESFLFITFENFQDATGYTLKMAYTPKIEMSLLTKGFLTLK